MKYASSWVALGMAVLVLFGFSAGAQAEADQNAYVSGSLRKLGRGIANIVTCPAEIVRTSSIEGREKGVIAESTTGVVHGVWRTLVRGVTGVFEVGTFFVEVPKGFEPLMKPEYVWAHNSWEE